MRKIRYEWASWRRAKIKDRFIGKDAGKDGSESREP